VRGRLKLAFVAVLSGAVLAPGAASGSDTADLVAISRDYTRDQRITPCRFTRHQLEGSRTKIGQDVASYAAGIDAAIAREIKRWRSGGCTKRHPVRVRIVAIAPKGAAGAESVTIKNVSSKAVSLRGYALRDADDHTLLLGTAKLAKGRKLRVVTGCRSGHRGAVRRGSRLYACRETAFWDDTGDVVQLLGPGGGLLSQKRY
jgi:hypothetical protein